MREIKFKIWSEIDKKFLENPHYINSNGIIFFSACKGPVIDYEGQEKYKILQYTGLKDKNGKEIYEFDYVEYKKGIYKLFFNKFKISLEDISKKDIIDLTDEILSDLSIKGNVYEN